MYIIKINESEICTCTEEFTNTETIRSNKIKISAIEIPSISHQYFKNRITCLISLLIREYIKYKV